MTQTIDLYPPEHLRLWTHPQNYIGEVWPGYYVFLGQHRDSDCLERSNFTCALEAIGGETETVHVIRERHWAVGWIEWIAIHQDDTAALQKADDIARKLQDYPVVNEDHWSELEHEEVCDFWASLSVRERASYCKEAGLSIFAARHDYPPQDDSGSLYDRLRS